MSRRRSSLVAALCAAAVTVLIPASPAAAGAGSITKSAGSVTATLAWQAASAEEYDASVSHPRLTISRGGTVVFDQEITDVCKTGCILVGDSPEFPDNSVLNVLDLDADGEPEVAVDTFSGGAHCCLSTRVYAYGAATNSYARAKSYDWLDAGYTLKDLDGDGRPEFSGDDASFAYAFSSYAASWFPPLVLSYGRDATTGKARFTNVTRRFPALVRTHAAKALKAIRKAKKSAVHEIQGAIAAYVADQYLLGKGSVGKAELERDRKKGLTTKNFAADLLKFLKRLGYR